MKALGGRGICVGGFFLLWRGDWAGKWVCEEGDEGRVQTI